MMLQLTEQGVPVAQGFPAPAEMGGMTANSLLMLSMLGIAVLFLAGFAIRAKLRHRRRQHGARVDCGQHLVVLPEESTGKGRTRLRLLITRPASSTRSPELDITRIPRPVWGPRREIANPLPLFRDGERPARAARSPEPAEAHQASASFGDLATE